MTDVKLLRKRNAPLAGTESTLKRGKWNTKITTTKLVFHRRAAIIS